MSTTSYSLKGCWGFIPPFGRGLPNYPSQIPFQRGYGGYRISRRRFPSSRRTFPSLPSRNPASHKKNTLSIPTKKGNPPGLPFLTNHHHLPVHLPPAASPPSSPASPRSPPSSPASPRSPSSSPATVPAAPYTTSTPCSASICKPISFSLNFWILPLPVRGKPSTNSTYFGIL